MSAQRLEQNGLKATSTGLPQIGQRSPVVLRSASSTCGVHGPQLPLQDLAVVVLRQRVDKNIILWPFEARNTRKAQRVKLRGIGIADHIGHHDLSPFPVRPAYYRHLAHLAMG